MVERNFSKEKNNIDITSEENRIFDLEPTDVMTGDSNKNRYLFYQLKQSIVNAKSIDIIVSFLMESGVKMLLKDLEMAY